MPHHIEPSRAHPEEPRRPFYTYEDQPDPRNPLRILRVPIAHITLPCGAVAQCELAAFNAAMKAGFSNRWFLHSNGHGWFYVRTFHMSSPRKPFMPARFIVSAVQGEHVRYLDKNPLNLRASNLGTREGFAKAAERWMVEDDGEF